VTALVAAAAVAAAAVVVEEADEKVSNVKSSRRVKGDSRMLTEDDMTAAGKRACGKELFKDISELAYSSLTISTAAACECDELLPGI
jgi:hypothetical protein